MTLREKVARKLSAYAWDVSPHTADETADAIIALVVEEAAKVVHDKIVMDWKGGDDWAAGFEDGRAMAVSAIRSLATGGGEDGAAASRLQQEDAPMSMESELAEAKATARQLAEWLREAERHLGWLCNGGEFAYEMQQGKTFCLKAIREYEDAREFMSEEPRVARFKVTKAALQP